MNDIILGLCLTPLSSHLFRIWIVLMPRPFKSPLQKARLNHQRKRVANKTTLRDVCEQKV